VERLATRYSVVDDTLYWMDNSGALREIPPIAFRKDIVKREHELRGHLGVRNMY
jgi:hypothetical protein